VVQCPVLGAGGSLGDGQLAIVDHVVDEGRGIAFVLGVGGLDAGNQLGHGDWLAICLGQHRLDAIPGQVVGHCARAGSVGQAGFGYDDFGSAGESCHDSDSYVGVARSGPAGGSTMPHTMDTVWHMDTGVARDSLYRVAIRTL